MTASRWLVMSLCLVAAACGGGKDNGGDDVPSPQCSDGKDNDGDGMIDFPDDLGCTSPSDDSEDSPPMPQCSDGRDNDGDGKVDFPNDPGCILPQQDDETDDCPNGPHCPQCSNGKDDDGNGATDYPNDPGCDSAADPNEFVNNPVACGQGMTIKPLPMNHMDSGMLDTTSISQVMSPCGGGGGSPAIAYVMLLTEPKVVVASTNDPGTSTDTVIDIRSAQCDKPTAEVACNDDADGTTSSSTITRSLPAGTYYLIVSGHDSSSLGAYALKVDMFSGEGSSCTAPEQCGPGLVCRPPNGGGAGMICQQPECNDAFDNNGDGKMDYPNDPGCSSPQDNSEDTVCPGAMCPECSDGIDNDGDGKIDFGTGANNDPSCHAAGDSSEACTTSEPVTEITGANTPVDTVGATNDANPTCGSSGGTGPDRLFRINLPKMAVVNFNLNGATYDTVHALFNSTCGGTAISCQDGTTMTVNNLAAGTYYLDVDGFFADDAGQATIALSGQIGPGGDCENAFFTTGVFTCQPGFTCDGTAGAKTCRTQCSDGIDNNGDGKIDFPNDPGCSSPADNMEDTVCPGAMCPACSDGIDNDGDGKTDFPMDTSCQSAGGTSESCQETEPIASILGPTTTGTTVGKTNDFNPTCASSTGSGPDVVLQLDLPTDVTNLHLDLDSAYDNVHFLLPASCNGTPLSCQDPNTMSLASVAAGRYFLVVDGFFSTSAGTFTLTTSGTIPPGGACNNTLMGALTCAGGLTCQGPAGNKKCTSQCSDGVDNDGDGKIDFPNDPGCTSLADDTETDTCPGAGCPQCADGVDNDADGKIDFPTDFGCTSAGGPTEAFCAMEPDFGGSITMPQTNGDLTMAAGNFTMSCQSNTDHDAAYSLALPVPVATLQVDTLGSTIGDTVLSVRDANCGVELACDDDSGSGTDDFHSIITLTNVARGNYAIIVDSFSTSNNGPFKLNVKGTVAPNTACTSPLFASGVLVCPTGTTCTGGTCH